jgi:hypothetical protein
MVLACVNAREVNDCRKHQVPLGFHPERKHVRPKAWRSIGWLMTRQCQYNMLHCGRRPYPIALTPQSSAMCQGHEIAAWIIGAMLPPKLAPVTR